MGTRTKAQKLEQSEARDYLRSICPAGTTLSTELLYVSRSGMLRIIAVQHPTEGDITREVATALGDNLRDVPHSATANYGRRGIRVDGCGMDMGFHLVYSLSSVLYRNGFECSGERYNTPNTGNGHATIITPRCPSNDHTNEREDNYTPGRVHRSGGYALSQRWAR